MLLPLSFALAALPAAVLVRHARGGSFQPSEWVMDAWRLALVTLLLMAAHFLVVALVADASMPPLGAAMSAGGAFVLALCLRTLARGTARPYVRGAETFYDRERQPVRFWLSLGWNSALGVMIMLATFGMTLGSVVHPGETACLESDGKRPAQEVAAACTLFLTVDGLNAWDRGIAHGARAEARAELRDERGAQGDWRAALANYGEALAEMPESAFLHHESGRALHAIGHLKPAREAYSAYLMLEPESGPGYVARGLVNLDDRRDLDAIADFTKAEALLPGEVWPIANRGMAHAWLGNSAEAMRDFKRARELDPDNVVVRRGEAMLALKAGDEEGALRLLTEALAKDPSDRWSANLKGQILRARDREAAAAGG